MIAPDGRFVEFVPMPDEITTNLCFGGAEMRDAYVTLSSTGRVVKLRWPRPGLRLNFDPARGYGPNTAVTLPPSRLACSGREAASFAARSGEHAVCQQ